VLCYCLSVPEGDGEERAGGGHAGGQGAGGGQEEAARRWMMMPSLDRVAASYCTLTQLKPRNRGMLCSPWSDAV
jgi:hypothetical protein